MFKGKPKGDQLFLGTTLLRTQFACFEQGGKNLWVVGDLQWGGFTFLSLRWVFLQSQPTQKRSVCVCLPGPLRIGFHPHQQVNEESPTCWGSNVSNWASLGIGIRCCTKFESGLRESHFLCGNSPLRFSSVTSAWVGGFMSRLGRIQDPIPCSKVRPPRSMLEGNKYGLPSVNSVNPNHPCRMSL